MTNLRHLTALAIAGSLALACSFAATSSFATETAVGPTDASSTSGSRPPATSVAQDASSSPDVPPTDAWEAHRFAVIGSVGSPGPLGVFGASGEYAFDRHFSWAAGAGTNGDLQVATMARVRLPFSDNYSAGLGLGSSYGRAFRLDLCIWGPCAPPPPHPITLNADAEGFFEARADSGLLARVFGGYHQELNGGDRRGGPYLGIAVGASF